MIRIALSAMTLAAMTSIATAQSGAAERLKALLQIGDPTNSYEGVVAELSKVVRLYDVNGDGVTDDELDVADLHAAAKARAQAAMQFLSADLDNDLQMTRAEREIFARLGNDALSVEQFDALDHDANGTIDWREVSDQAVARGRIVQKANLRRVSLDIDPTPGTPFTLADATTLADELFAVADLNDDRLVDGGERRTISAQERLLAPAPRSQLTGRVLADGICRAPKALPGDQAVFVGTHEGLAYATSFVGRSDVPSHVVRVHVAPGPEQIYFMGSAYTSVIWQFTGATERVRQAVLAGVEAQGALGLARERVTIEVADDCFPLVDDLNGISGVDANIALRDFTSHDETSMAAAPKVFGVYVPEMKLIPTPEGSTPGAMPLIAVPPEDVVATEPARSYEVLPGRAGLVQLVATGALEPLGGDDFRIAKPIPHFPAALGNAVRLLLGRGIPMPSGSAGRACVIDEVTGARRNPAAPC